MKKHETLKQGEVYVYDKDKGFELYNPLSYSFKGYTIDKLYELVQHYKNKVDEYEFALEDLKEYLEGEGINTHKKSLYELTARLRRHIVSSNKGEITYLEVNDEGYIVKATRMRSNDVLTRDSVSIPEDIEKGVYRLINGQIIKDEHKEAELWKVY